MKKYFCLFLIVSNAYAYSSFEIKDICMSDPYGFGYGSDCFQVVKECVNRTLSLLELNSFVESNNKEEIALQICLNN